MPTATSRGRRIAGVLELVDRLAVVGLAVLAVRNTTPNVVVYQAARSLLCSCAQCPTSSSR